jgi:ubiquinone/menaquinone biosynthesis C-methylase UbiE
MQLAKVFPKARCVGVDIDPTGMKQARAALKKAGLADRIELVAGQIGDAVADGSVDAIVMIEVLHEIAPGIRQTVIDDCGRALAPGGWLLIVDETYPSTLAQSREAEFLFPVQTGFEELTWGNVLPTREEQETLLKTAGFKPDVGRAVIGEGFTVLSAQK